MNDRQLETLRVIAHWREGLPTASSIAEVLGLSHESGARARLQHLEEQGFILRHSLGVGLPKVLRLTRRGREVLGLVDEPRVLDLKPSRASLAPVYPIPCGPLGEAIAEPEMVQHPFHAWQRGDYLLVADGDSMWNRRLQKGVPPGSKLRMREDVYPENGDVVHAEFIHDNGAHECTLKVFHQDEISGVITLQAINDEYPDIVLPADRVEIKGVAQEIVAPMERFARLDRK